MATLLRSLKFVRRLNLRGRRLGSPSAALINKQLLQSSRAQCVLLHDDRTYVTNPAAKPKSYNDNSIDKMLNELDQRVRNYQTINKGNIEQILHAATEKGTLTSTQALLLIRCCGEFLNGESPQVRNSLVDQIWEIVNELGVSLDVSHYNALLLVYLDNERDFSPVDILLQLKEKNIEPNRVTFQRLIEQYCNKGDIAGATKILEHMSQQEIPINENIFNSLIKGHSEAGDITNAIKILDIMKNAGIEPSSRTYAAILCAHAKKGDMESIRTTFNECREKNILLADKEILDVIYTLAINAHFDLIDEMMTYLSKSGLYNKEVLTYILKLIEKDCTEVAYKLLKTMIKPERVEGFESGGFFLRKLVVLEKSPEEIIKYCKLLKEEKLHNSPFELAVIYTFTHGNPHLALPIMKAWAETGAEIREHYFYPIFVAHSKDNNLQGLLNTVKTMVFDFKIVPSIMTIKEYIVPYLVEDASANARTLVNNHLSFSNAAHAILLHLINQSKVQQANKFMSSINMRLRLGMFPRPLARALNDSKDAKSIASMVHRQYVLAQKYQNENSEDRLTPIEFSSLVVSKAASELPAYNTKLITELLEHLLEKGVAINEEAAEHVKVRLGQNITAEIESILQKLVSDDLKPQDIDINGNENNQRRRSDGGLQRQADGSPEFKMLLLQQYARNGDKEAVTKSLSELEQENVTYSVGFCAVMGDYFSKIGNIEEATKWFNKIKEIKPDCKVDKAKLLNYAIALVKSHRIDEALQVLKSSINDADTNRNTLCEKLLDNVSNHYPERVEEFFNLMHTQGFFGTATNSLMGPLIRVPLRAGDTAKAIEKFKWACENYKLTPCKLLLMSQLIKDEDAKNLKYVTDLVSKVYGEMNSLFDLAIAFYECDRPRQARKILETPGLRLSRDRLRSVAEKYYQYDDPRLEGFVQLLNGLFLDIDQFNVLLLKFYGKNNEWQKCLALWTQMQEDNVQPSTTFMEELERILKQCNQEIPFATSHRALSMEDNRLNEDFIAAVTTQNFEQAENILNKMSGEVQGRHRLKLSEAYLASDDLNNALSHLLIALDEKKSLLHECPDFIENCIAKLVDSGNFEVLVNLMTKLREKLRRTNRQKKTKFVQFLNEYYLNQGKYDEYLSQLEKLIADPKSDRFTLMSLFDISYTTSVLLQHPEFVENIKKIALAAFERSNYLPMNSLWAYHFIKGNPEAEQLWNEYFKSTIPFYGGKALDACKKNGAWDKLPKLAELISLSQMQFRDKQIILNEILEELIASDEPKKYELAYDCLRQTVKIMPIEKLDKKILLDIQSNLADGLSIESLKLPNDRVKEEATA